MFRGHASAGCSVILNLSIFLMLSIVSEVTTTDLSVMRAAKCLIPNGIEHIKRTILLQQCLSKNYAQGNETRCYDELGCFPMDFPWTSILRPFPSPLHPAEINVRPYCYTRESMRRYNITLWPKISLEGCPFKSSWPTAFIVHGFANNGNYSWLSELKDIYLAAVDANVFLVDWGQGAELLNYLQVASNTRIVGAELARFLKWLQNDKGLKPEQVHLMGHSLGAQISAYASKAFRGIGRLTALDPAQPGFEGAAKEVRLDRDDANYVEVLHTNALPFIPTLGFGLMLPHGHVDFYLNGGLEQPGCHIPKITNIKGIGDLVTFPVETVAMWVKCSHERAVDYYTQTLRNNCIIWGRQAHLPRHILNGMTMGIFDPVISIFRKCDANSCLPIGLETPNFKARGTFAATTTSGSPYCETDPAVNSRILAQIKGTASGSGVLGVCEKQEVKRNFLQEILCLALKIEKDLVEGAVNVGKNVSAMLGKIFF